MKINRRQFMQATGAVAAASALAACGATDSSSTAASSASTSADVTESTLTGGELVWNLKVEPNTWDPSLSSDSTADNLDMHVFECMTINTVDGVMPGAAESWECAEDGLTWTFHLREDGKWSDGTPVTAHDFYYSWMRMCDPEVASAAAAGMLDYVQGAKEFFNGEGTKEDVKLVAVDDYTLEVTLISNLPYFPQQTGMYNYGPVKEEYVALGEGWEKDPTTAISNGPFVLSEYQIGSHIVLKKNEMYWGASEVNLDTIKVVFLNDANTALQAFETGEIDVNPLIPTTELARLVAEEPNLYIGQNPGTNFLAFNMDKEPVADGLIRHALTLAIDRKAIVEQVLCGGQLPATGLLAPGMHKSDGITEYVDIDPATGLPVQEFNIDPTGASVEAAQQLLAEAGYPNGEGFPAIEFLYSTSDTNKKLAEAIQSMWKENLGIDVTLRNEEWQVFLDTKELGNYTIATGGWIANPYDASGMMKQFKSDSGSNAEQWRWQETVVAPHDTVLNPDNELFDELYLTAMNSVGDARDAGWEAVEEYIMEVMPVCPIYFYNNPVLINQDKFEGVFVTAGGNTLLRGAYLL